MVRGTAFLHARAAVIEARGTASVSRHAMVLANALRELDCFLLVLLDEIAASAGLRGTALTAFKRRRSAANKLAAYPALFGGSADDLGILLTLGKQKAVLLALFRGRRTTAGDILVAAKFSTIDLRTISTYYAGLSVRLIGHAELAGEELPLAA
ncbi:hypothetical protein WP12_12835 [Sphingomonas sp. SRS2]|nr:hypothetical protein WP12_12835 [Sphingomonas sp. SRS2]